MTNLLSRLREREPLIFTLLVLANAWPLVWYGYFPTVDGPAHVYNARLLLTMLTDSNSTISDFYALNLTTFTNVVGHFFIAGLMLVMPGWLAQKVIMLLCVVGLPVAFRYFIKLINPNQIWFSLLVLPFAYSFALAYGFYNFLLGLVFLFWGMGLWLKWLNRGHINSWGLLAISAAVFFSHLFVFAAFMLFVGTTLTIKLIKRDNYWQTAKSLIIRAAAVLLPFVVLFIVYFLRNPVSNGPSTYLTLYDRVFMILSVDAAKTFDYGKEGIYTKWFFIGFCLLFLHGLYHGIKTRFTLNAMQLGLLLTTTVLVACYFLLPNQTGGFVGFITTRFLLLFFLVGIGFFASIPTPSWLQGIVVALFMVFSGLLFSIYQPILKTENQRFAALKKAAEQIDEGAIVVPITKSSKAYHAHLSNAIGYEQPLAITENYEATLPYFPVVWRTADSPEVTIPPNTATLPWPLTQGTVKKTADYLLLISETADAFNDIAPQLNSFKTVYNWQDQIVLLKQKQ